MKMKVVRSFAQPKYPQKQEIDNNRALLSYQPQSWLQQPLIKSILGLLLVTALAACEEPDYGMVMGGEFNELPPSLFERNALRIIEEQLRIAGYQMTWQGDTVDFVFDAKVDIGTKSINLEYVTVEDYYNQKYPEIEITEDGYPDTEEITRLLQDKYQEAAFFYAPDNYEAEEALKAQVTDFIEWLKTLGGDY